MIDTHSHLYLPDFDDDREVVMQRARDAGVQKVLLPNIDVSTMDALLAMEADFPGEAIAMMGLHPCSVKNDYKEQLDKIKASLDARPYIAVGEIGTDMYWDQSTKDQQIEAFQTQLGWAAEMGLPVAIHSRDSLPLNVGIVQSLQDGRLSGVFHCFNGNVEEGRSIIALGFYLGIGGVVTFRNAGVDRVVAELPIESMILETDAPYLTPAPHRGKRNESAYLTYIVEKIAEVQGLTVEEVLHVTTQNAQRLFGLAE